MRLKFIQTAVASVALFVASLNANAGIIECNMDDISNPNYSICVGLDTDNNQLSLDVTTTGNDVNYGVANMSITDLENMMFFVNNSIINHSLSSTGDLFLSVGGLLYNGFNNSDNNLKLTLDISDILKDSILRGEGINYAVNFANLLNNDHSETYFGEAFYNPSNNGQFPVPEPLSIGILALGLACLAASRRKKQKLAA